MGRQNIIGVISDTHGLMRQEALDALQGSDLILHAGDVGALDVLRALEKIAPVIAVRGNNDRGDWADGMPLTQLVEIGSVKIYLIHDLKEIELQPKEAGFGVVVSGHSHKPQITKRDGTLFLNPGSAGPKRFKLPVSLAKLTISGRHFNAELMQLAV